MATITIFGGSGFLGRYVVAAFAKKGHQIKVVSRDPEHAKFLKPLGDVGQIRTLSANLNDESAVNDAIVGSDIVINCVGILAENGFQKFDKIHHLAVERIARLSKKNGATKLIHVSAIGADDDSQSKYAMTKASGESAVIEAFPSATIVRPSLIIGPEDQFFNRFATLARIMPALPLIGGGMTRFQPVYVGDIAQAILKISSQKSSEGKIYELGGPKVYTFKELMAFTLKAINKKRLLFSIPFPFAYAQGAILQILPKPLLTVDQVKLLKRDNIVGRDEFTFADLEITPQAIEPIAEKYLERFRCD